MSKLFSIFAAALMLTVSVAAFQPSQAATSGYGQQQQTGAYAAGGSAYWPRGGN